MAFLASQTMSHQKTISPDHQVSAIMSSSLIQNTLKKFLSQDQVSRMYKESLQLIIKVMRLLSSMQLMLTYINNLGLKHHKWVEEVEAKYLETNPVMEVEDKVDPKPVDDTSVAVSISVGLVVLLSSSITVKFAKSRVQVSDKTT